MSKENASSCIETVPIFKNLTKDELNQVIEISNHKSLEKGKFIFTAGDTLDGLYVVHRGKIKITRYSEDGKEQIIRILSHGEFLGELALFSNETVNTYAEAIEPSIVCMVEHQGLKDLMSKSPLLSFKMMKELSKRLEKAEALIEHSNLYNALAKVTRLLLDLEKENIVLFQTTKVNLSSSIGITPETFSRKLAELSDLGYIDIINNKTIRILDKKGLIGLIQPNKL
ncbi:Crp/Fnr family transcriptional regulator [Acholeplasma vituli]|uniref:Crp/Fnr family transcriptional regulator n=1 Tax=Paracholeplasma vituli TaxID=69473 RepID=A0ABT2PXB8_9MOLU|nr:Crp/Fnr family transcriptional regulator [Paracholeplasma vituli]MCU0105091.1 Crp/Fnr family transcriptional regulator [Paracholeplasma vituli]